MKYDELSDWLNKEYQNLLEIENKSKLAQTGGDFTISGLIYTGLTLMTIAFVMSRKEFGGLE